MRRRMDANYSPQNANSSIHRHEKKPPFGGFSGGPVSCMGLVRSGAGIAAVRRVRALLEHGPCLSWPAYHCFTSKLALRLATVSI